MFISWWVGYKLPAVHYKNKNVEFNGHYLRKLFRNYFLHPVKRRIAKYYLVFLQNIFGTKVIGISGSAGKTTTKEMPGSILSLEGSTVVTFENIDPVYNIPTTILKCTPKTKYLILEMGVEYPNEMDFYLWLARPDIAIITNIYPTHLLYFGSEEGVFKEIRKLAEGVCRKGFVVLNRDNKYLKTLEGKLSTGIIWFGKGQEICTRNLSYTKDFNTKFDLILKAKNEKSVLSIKLPMLGDNYAENAAAAAACAFKMGISVDYIKKGLSDFDTPKHRMRIINKQRNIRIFDDSYNNNPKALESSLEIFFQICKTENNILVIGDMLELGELEKEYHETLAEYLLLNRKKIKNIFLIGKAVKYSFDKINKQIRGGKVRLYPEWKMAVNDIKNVISKGDNILVKGSRSIHLDELVGRL